MCMHHFEKTMPGDCVVEEASGTMVMDVYAPPLRRHLSSVAMVTLVELCCHGDAIVTLCVSRRSMFKRASSGSP